MYCPWQVQRARLSLSPSRLAASIEDGWHSETKTEMHTHARTNSASVLPSGFVVDSEALLQEYRQFEHRQQRHHETVLGNKDAVAKPQFVRSHRESIAAVRAMVANSNTRVSGSGEAAVAGTRDRSWNASATAPSTPDVAAGAGANTGSRSHGEGAEVRLQVLSCLATTAQLLVTIMAEQIDFKYACL